MLTLFKWICRVRVEWQHMLCEDVSAAFSVSINLQAFMSTESLNLCIDTHQTCSLVLRSYLGRQILDLYNSVFISV